MVFEKNGDFFKKFVKTLRPERDVLCYQTLVKMMNEAFERMITNMKNDFAQVENVCVTADLWSAAILWCDQNTQKQTPKHRSPHSNPLVGVSTGGSLRLLPPLQHHYL